MEGKGEPSEALVVTFWGSCVWMFRGHWVSAGTILMSGSPCRWGKRETVCIYLCLGRRCGALCIRGDRSGSSGSARRSSSR